MPFDATQGYASIPVPAASLAGALVDFSLMVDLSRMPAEWWAAVSSDGASIRCSKDDGATELAYDLLSWDYGSETGWLRVLWAGTLSAVADQSLRIYPAADEGAGGYLASDTYGQHNAYDSGWALYWPMEEDPGGGAVLDRTGNARHGTIGGTPDAATGKAGQALNFVPASTEYVEIQAAAVTDWPMTLMIWADVDNPTAEQILIGLAASTSNTQYLHFAADTTSKWEWQLRTSPNAGYGNTNFPFCDGGTVGNGWTHVAARTSSATDHRLFENGVEVASTDVSCAFPSGMNRTTVGRQMRSTPYGSLDGRADEAQIHSAARPDEWIAAEHSQTGDQAGFFGAISWTPAAGGGGSTLTAEVGAVAITGQAAGLVASRQLVASPASYALAGIAADLLADRQIATATGAFSVTGQDAEVLVERILTAAAGALTISGQDATLIRGRTLSAGAGSFAIAGQPAALLAERILAAATESFTITGQDADLLRGRRFVAEAGAFAITGIAADVLTQRLLAIDAGALSISGQASRLLASRIIAAGSGTYTLTGIEVGVQADRRIVADAGAFVLSGKNATLVYSGAAGDGLLLQFLLHGGSYV